MLFLWLKAFHIIFMVCWFACLFYLPRLFVNFAIAKDPATLQQLIVMQQKLLRFSVPFAALTVIVGGWLASLNVGYYLHSPWFITKIIFVASLILYHGWCARIVAAFAAGKTPRSDRYYRIFNEFPVLVLFGAIILAVVKPFS
jgi:protoporphyrinogen IX oxidase